MQAMRMMRPFNSIRSQATADESLIAHAQSQANHQFLRPSSISSLRVDQGLPRRSPLSFSDQQAARQPVMFNSLGQQQEFKPIPTMFSHMAHLHCVLTNIDIRRRSKSF
ncbi:hypothetical protein QN277_022291 [Acacia crassicarpa]|uniref:Uncharacterized protein n=1 Tax=Acacia crassicarpa TaxID=499986 RepID=A0AAE1JI59_9FABA|nr:hypothetical protein QN277_022291 [Acacia crassicarpa]